ncbi:MAG: AMP-binding protein, partial [Oscillospiraceae bacterium]|nr:AMP-binding protein [Oscillospiraceae bacterium]
MFETPANVKTPWLKSLGDVPLHLNYFEGSLFDAINNVAKKYPDNVAFDFMGRSTTFKVFIEKIVACAKSLKTIGVRAGDKITIAMPNCPQAICMFYAVN